jgi:hypothetical protein
VNISHVHKVIYPRTTALLNGSASHDPDGSILSYSWYTLEPQNTGAVIENPSSDISNLSNLIPGLYTIGLVVEDNDFSTSANTIQILVLGEAKQLLVQRQPSPCSIAGKYLSIQPVASVNDDLGNVIEETHDLNLTAALLQMNSHVFENVSNFAPPSFWQGRLPCVPNAGCGAFTDLVVFKTGFYSVQFFALRLISAISDAFVIMSDPTENLEVIGLMSGCFLQEHVLSPKLQFLILDSL